MPIVQEILPHLYRLEIPLTGSPLRSLNCYVIKGAWRNLIVDTGWNRKECMDAMVAGLKKLDVALERTDFFITHLHVDHIGLVPSLVMNGAKVYFNRKEAANLEAGVLWRPETEYALMSGFPKKDLQALLHNHPAIQYGVKRPLVLTILNQEDTVCVGDFEFRCIETPGHSRGHMCLYESHKKVLLAGDHLLNDITPNIQVWSEDRNPLKDYLRSLERLFDYDIQLVLPGHREIFKDWRKRVLELKRHHHDRLNEILTILGREGKSAFEVASRMSWDISGEYKSWDSFPVQQKWFATGEAISHLRYLEEAGHIEKEIRGQKIFYRVQPDAGIRDGKVFQT